MKRYRRVADLVAAIQRGEVPKNVISTGAAAAVLGVTRQAVTDLYKRGVLPAWGAERVVLIDGAAVQARVKQKRGIPAEQGDLYAST
jgi:hypothetical protein